MIRESQNKSELSSISILEMKLNNANDIARMNSVQI